MSSSLKPNPSLLDIAPYVGGESALKGCADVLKLSSNESPYGAPPKAVAALKEAAVQMHRYPDGGSVKLRTALADYYGLPAEQLVCGAGSDELIGLLCQAYAAEGDEIIHTAHGFLMYALYAKAVGAVPVSVPEQDLTADIDAILAAVTDKTRIVFLANPNNPTGTYLPVETVVRLRENLPAHILLVLDAAYAEFVGKDDYEVGHALVDRYDNIAVTRTFSKLFGLGGVRLGWCHADPAIIDVLNRIRSPFNVSRAAQAAGEGALEDKSFLDDVCEKTVRDRTAFQAWMSDEGISFVPSYGNFVLVRVADAAAVDAFLRKKGIIVRQVASYGLPDYLRVTIGTAADMERLRNALKEAMSHDGLI